MKDLLKSLAFIYSTITPIGVIVILQSKQFVTADDSSVLIDLTASSDNNHEKAEKIDSDEVKRALKTTIFHFKGQQVKDLINLEIYGKHFTITNSKNELISKSDNGWNSEWFTDKWNNGHLNDTSFPLLVKHNINSEKDLAPEIQKSLTFKNDYFSNSDLKVELISYFNYFSWGSYINNKNFIKEPFKDITWNTSILLYFKITNTKYDVSVNSDNLHVHFQMPFGGNKK